MLAAPSAWRPPMFTPKLITAGGLSWLGSLRDLQGHAVKRRPVGRGHSACGHVDPRMRLTSELAE
eukprot:4761200-Pyramimonas_sp.AAC.1